MTDRELLELAAKAAGYDINFEEPVNGWFPFVYDEDGDVDQWWNPLKSGDDALRLAVKLCLHLGLEDSVSNAWLPGEMNKTWAVERHGKDAFLATCRAIVCSAAEIGKTL